MKDTLMAWLSRQNDIEELYYRYLKNGEYTEELNTFFEIKNRIPIALTGMGHVVYAEIFGDEILFSSLNPDYREDTHLADSIAHYEEILKGKNTDVYLLHIEQYSEFDIRDKETGNCGVRQLIKELGPLEKDEIYGYGDDFFDIGTGTFHRRKRTIASYLFKAIEKFTKKDWIWYDGVFSTSYNIDKDAQSGNPLAIKACYLTGIYSTPVEKISNLRAINNSDYILAEHSTKLNYYSDTSCWDEEGVMHCFSKLKNNHELLTISINDKFKSRAGTCMDVSTYPDLLSFPILKRIEIANLELARFPEELIQLKHLERISFLDTGLQELPSSIAQATQLKELELNNMPLDGKLDAICQLVSLEKLELCNCGITTLPDEFQQLKKLKCLNLNGNPLAVIPDWILKLDQLKTLSLNNCKLKGVPENMGDFAQMEELDLKLNAFAALPKSLLKLRLKVKIEPRAKALYDEKVRKKLEEDGHKPAVIKDFGIRMMVIQVLMYEMELLLPKFDVYEFVKNYKGRKININKEGEDMIPEVKKFFKELEIPMVLLDELEEIGEGMEIYRQISPMWGGEDDYYNVKSVKDLKQMPNLKKIHMLGELKEEQSSQLAEMGIEEV